MLTFDQDFVTGEPSVELAHEAIIRECGQLRTWLDESRDDVRLQRLLAGAATHWIEAGCDPSYLLLGSRLAQFREWAATTQVSLTQKEQAFLETSITEEQQQMTRRRRVRNLVFTVLVIIAVVMAGLALVARDRERMAAREAEVRHSLALSASAQEAVLTYNTDLAVALALEAYSIEDPPVEAERAVAAAIYAPGTRRVFTGHEGPITSVDISPDGRYALSAGGLRRSHVGDIERYVPDPIQDYTVRMWNLETGEEVGCFEGHEGSVWDVAFGPDGLTALSASSDKTLILWDVDPASPSFGELIRRLEGHEFEVRSVAFSPDGQAALSGDANYNLYLWDVESGQQERRFRAENVEPSLHGGSNIWNIAFSSDGRTALAGYESGVAVLWNLATGEELRRLELRYSADETLAVALSPDSHYALTGNIEHIAGTYDDFAIYMMILWDLETGEEVQRYYHGCFAVTGVAFNPDGLTAISVDDGLILYLWDLQTGQVLHRLSGHTGPITDVALTSDGRRALTSAEDGTLRLWDLHNGAEVYRLPVDWVVAVALSPDGHTAATGSLRNAVALWDVETGTMIRQLQGHNDSVMAVAFAPDGRTLFSGGQDGRILLWDVETGEQIERLVFRDVVAPVTGIAVSPGGRYLLVSSRGAADVYSDGTPETHKLVLFDLETRDVVRTFEGHLDPVNSVAISPDGRYGLSGSNDFTLRLWDLATGEEIRRFTNHIGNVYRVAISSDGRYALSGSTDRSMIMWDMATGEELHRFEGHSEVIYGGAFSPDGRFALSGGNDRQLILWDVETGEELRRYRDLWRIWDVVAISADGRDMLSGSEHHPPLWRISDTPDEIIAWGYENRYIRELSCLERQTYGVEPLCTPGETLPTRTPYLTLTPSLVPSMTPTINWTQVTATPTWTPFPSLTPTATPEKPTPEPQGELTPGVMVMGSYLLNGRDQWTYSGTAQQTISINFNGVGQKLIILNPDGSLLLESNGPSIGPVALPDTGTYAFIIESETSMPGSYMLTINQE